MQESFLTGDPRRRNRYLLVIGVVLLLTCLIWVARGALLPYILAMVLAYLLLPLVNGLDRLIRRRIKRPGLSRALAIVLVYLAMIGVVVAFISMLVPVLAQQFDAIWGMRDRMAIQMGDLFQRTLEWYRQTVPADLQTQVEANLARMGATLSAALQTGFARSIGLVTGTVGFILGFLVIPFWLFYVMYDQRRIENSFSALIPRRYREDVHNILTLIDTVLGAYIRGQALLCVVIGLMAFFGLSVLGVRFPHVLALVAGMLEFLPFIGPILGAVPAVLVALIQSPALALSTVLLYFAIQQIENVLLAPRIAGSAVELHPAAIMVVLVIGNEVAGLGGMLVAVPLTAVARDVFQYLYARWQDEPCSPADAMKRMGRTPAVTEG